MFGKQENFGAISCVEWILFFSFFSSSSYPCPYSFLSSSYVFVVFFFSLSQKVDLIKKLLIENGPIFSTHPVVNFHSRDSIPTIPNSTSQEFLAQLPLCIHGTWSAPHFTRNMGGWTLYHPHQTISRCSGHNLACWQAH